MTELILAPFPRHMTMHPGIFDLPTSGSIAIPHSGLLFEATWIQEVLANYAISLHEGVIRLHEDASLPAEGYTLTIDADGVQITGRDAAGVFYGLCTLRQIILNTGTHLPMLTIEDHPDYAHRGYMLDVSRDRVPTRAELFRLVDQLAALKINQLQLYVEHTFAYPDHQLVWELADPLTPEDILLLDQYCRARHIELVPNQNSLGHMERWLKHAPYQYLAEMPGGFLAHDDRWRSPSTLAPLEAGSFQLVQGLYDVLLPHFTSKRFNVGCDEPWELGQGKSKEAVSERGGNVYVDWLMRLYEDIRGRGYEMMFWGDIIIHYPELIPLLPRDVVVMEWGYEATHPFEENCQKYADAGLPFYVCPGTSSWNALVGRTDNMMGNIRSAARHGLAQGAVGCLITDWGDNGHWQPPTASDAGILYGAAVTWAYEPNHGLDLAAALNRLIFHDDVLGQVAVDAGNLYQRVGLNHINGNLLAYALQWGKDDYQKNLQRLERWGGASADFAPDTLRGVMAEIDALNATLQQSNPRRADAALLVREWAHALDLLHFGAKWLLALQEIESPAALKQEWERLIMQQRENWLGRSRRGGLEDSMRRFEIVQKQL